VLFDRVKPADFKYVRKQGTQLASKMRFLSSQLIALLSNDLWRRNALHANHMASLLQSELRRVDAVSVVYPVDANAVFARMDRAAAARLRTQYFFYTWDERESIMRWMCSWDTTEDDVRRFVREVESAVR